MDLLPGGSRVQVRDLDALKLDVGAALSLFVQASVRRQSNVGIRGECGRNLHAAATHDLESSFVWFDRYLHCGGRIGRPVMSDRIRAGYVHIQLQSSDAVVGDQGNGRALGFREENSKTIEIVPVPK